MSKDRTKKCFNSKITQVVCSWLYFLLLLRNDCSWSEIFTKMLTIATMLIVSWFSLLFNRLLFFRLSGVTLITLFGKSQDYFATYTGIMQTHTRARGHWHLKLWSHHSSPAEATLVTSATSTGILNLSWGLQDIQQPGTVLSFRWLSTHYRDVVSVSTSRSRDGLET